MAQPRPIVQISLETGKILQEFSSASEAARVTGFTPENISACCRGKTKSAHGYLWLYKEESTPKKIAKRLSDARTRKKGSGNPNPVVQISPETGKILREFSSGSEAVRATGFPPANISACCRGKQKSAHGFLWLFKKDATPKEIARRLVSIKKRRNSVPKPIVQISLETGKILREFSSITKTARATGFSGASISQCCRGKLKSAHGYLWLCKEEATPKEIAKRLDDARTRKKGSGNPKPIVQTSLETGEILQEFSSITKTARATGFSRASISACCRGKLKSTHGYLWLFKKDATPKEIARRLKLKRE